MLRTGAATVVVLAMVTIASRAFAADPFEIQVYDGTANRPRQFGLEMHANYVANGRSFAEAPELPMDRQAHLTFEPSYGVTPFWELGAYFQTALHEERDFRYAGAKFRSKFVTTPNFHDHVRLGLNFEIGALPSVYDRDQFGAEVRPIAAWANEKWQFAINPNLGVGFTADSMRYGPTFEPALSVTHYLSDVLGFGAEYYASFGPLFQPLPFSEEEHYVYEIVEWQPTPALSINAGVGEGLTDASNPITFKMIVGFVFDDPSPPETGLAMRRRTAKTPLNDAAPNLCDRGHSR